MFLRETRKEATAEFAPDNRRISTETLCPEENG
jgi:hypothetical protein